MDSKKQNYSHLPIASLSRVFKNTTNSYKLYWFYSILQIIKEEDKTLITFEEITAKMIASAWYTINFFKISFGKQDKLRLAVESIKKISNLKDDDKPEIIYPIIIEHLKHSKEVTKIITDFHRYVPYRFLAPFFETELRGKEDSSKNDIIKSLTNSKFSQYNNIPFYKILDNTTLEIHPLWMSYFKKHIIIIESFIFWNLVKFLQKRNPNIPNIGEKLFWIPRKRDLKNAKKFWKLFLHEKPLNCIFSNQTIENNNFAIDHFIPWSFVTHDLLWNLIPIQKNVNSSKSNNLPELSLYFKSFAHAHYDAFQTIYPKNKKILEDYSLLFQEELNYIARFSESDFSERLYNNIAPLVQVAANTGFSPNWVYSK